jgi:hypothetical protein
MLVRPDITAGTTRKEPVISATNPLFDPELDRLILRFEGLLHVCKILERRGASETELQEHRRALERTGRELAALVARLQPQRAA